MTFIIYLLLAAFTMNIVGFLKDSARKDYRCVPEFLIRSDRKDKELDKLLTQSILLEQRLKQLNINLNTYLLKIQSIKTTI